MKNFRIIILFILAALVILMDVIIYRQTNQSSLGNSKTEGPTVEDFALLDQNGKFQELYYYSDRKAVVIIVQGNGCPILRQSAGYIKQLQEKYETLGVTFLMINVNPQDDRAAIVQEARDYNLNFPILKDDAAIIAQTLLLHRSAEVVLINPSDWRIVYRGAINDQFGYETQKSQPSHHYLRDAIEDLLTGRKIRLAYAPAQGCLMTSNQASKEITYTKDVAPILQQHCVVCHSPDGVAPWSMNGYEKIKGWGPMIREVIRTRRMPPWHADREYGHWQDDISLTAEEQNTLVRWVEKGFVRGEGEDPLVNVMPKRQSQWALGEPDIIVELKEEQNIVTVGLDWFIDIDADKMIENDSWIRAIEIKPSNPRVVHHANLIVGNPTHSVPDESAAASMTAAEKEKWYQLSGMSLEKGEVVAGYSPGNGLLIFPQDTGIFIPKNSKLIFRMHYIPTGKQEKDRTQAGLYLYAQRPTHVCSVETINNRSIKIPPGQKDYYVTGFYTFNEEVTLIAIQPHMHYRGKSMRFIAEYPDGKKEILLSVPNYKFRWQRRYAFQKPLHLLAGTRIVAEGFYDNSSENPENPDPAQNVVYGPRSNQEMFTGILFYIKSQPPSADKNSQ